MRLKTKLVGQTITTMPPKDIRRADGTPNELMHDAACAHALMLAMEEEPEFPGQIPDEMWEALRNDRDALTFAFGAAVRATKAEIKQRADSILREWGFDSGEDAS